MGMRDKIVRALLGEVGGAHPGGIAAYHVSPFDFDKFDLSKIGTGEGAQVYGHGIYAAENPMVSGQGGQYWNAFTSRFEGPELNAATTLQDHGFNRDRAIAATQAQLDDVQRYLKEMADIHKDLPWQHRQSYQDVADMRQKELELLQSGAPVGPRTYELNIRAQPSEMLNWDQPMGAQSPSVIDAMYPRVQNLLDRSGSVRAARLERGTDAFGRPLKPAEIERLSKPPVPFEEVPGSQGYKFMGLPAVTEAEAQLRASTDLNAAGVPGIKYLDQGSRAMGGGTHNYVVFDPSRIDILQKYGVIGAPAGALGMGAVADQSQYEAPP